jgi:type II secretion system protein G
MQIPQEEKAKMFEPLSHQRKQEGFTLIELLIVIVILGILAAVVVFAVGGISDKGTNAACKSDVKTLETAVEAYYAKNTAYPTTGGDLVTAKLIREYPPSSDKYDVVYESGGLVKSGAEGATGAGLKTGSTGCPA